MLEFSVLLGFSLLKLISSEFISFIVFLQSWCINWGIGKIEVWSGSLGELYPAKHACLSELRRMPRCMCLEAEARHLVSDFRVKPKSPLTKIWK